MNTQEKELRKHEEWRITRNFLREGDPCRVKGVRGVCTFRAYVERFVDGELDSDYVEVIDCEMKYRAVRPERVRRVAVTRNGKRVRHRRRR